jgi:hypothetical protein
MEGSLEAERDVGGCSQGAWIAGQTVNGAKLVVNQFAVR